MKKIHLRPELAPPALKAAQKAQIPWEDFSLSEDGHQLRQAKCDEQGGLCGYCECRLAAEDGKLPKRKAHIDHFLPRHRGSNPHPELTYEWNNMVLSCLRKKTCGIHKDRQSIPAEALLNPNVDNPRDFITFVWTSSQNRACMLATPRPGLSDEASTRARNTIDALNLNDEALLRARTNAVWVYDGDIQGLAEALEDEDLHELAAIDFGYFLLNLEQQPFCSALLAYAKAQCAPLCD